MKRHIPSNRCPFCGGPAEADCVDNHGKPYKGCSSGCRIKSLKEIEAMCATSPGAGEDGGGS